MAARPWLKMKSVRPSEARPVWPLVGGSISTEVEVLLGGVVRLRPSDPSLDPSFPLSRFVCNHVS